MPPLNKDFLRAKSLEVWLSLANFKQAGGGAIGVQALDGSVFDAVVFGEREPDCWMAGSNNFARTQSFDGPPETAADKELVQIVIVYCDDGTIRCYRNGDPYGKPYRTAGPVTFSAGQSEVIFGLRHGSPGGNRMLSGVISRAPLSTIAASSAMRRPPVPRPARTSSPRRPSWLGLLPARGRASSAGRGVGPRQAAVSETARRMCYAVTPRPGEPAHLRLRATFATSVPSWRRRRCAIKELNPDFGLAAEGRPEESCLAALARWITSPANPLFSRVIVNRLWHHHFGIGLVHTPNDFGFNGASESSRSVGFLGQWAVAERLEFEAVASHDRAFGHLPASRAPQCSGRGPRRRQSSMPKPLRRLEAESVRDAILAVAGELNLWPLRPICGRRRPRRPKVCYFHLMLLRR